MQFVCSKCGHIESVATRKAHCGCGGLWNLDFQPPKFDLGEIDTHEWSQFRYRKFMALDGDVWRTVTMGEGMTPIVRLDEDVLLKMDYFMPTLSFKDRGAGRPRRALQGHRRGQSRSGFERQRGQLRRGLLREGRYRL